jgi:hypothetical protein
MTSLTDLQLDVLHNVFDFLEPRDACTLKCVSKYFNDNICVPDADIIASFIVKVLMQIESCIEELSTANSRNVKLPHCSVTTLIPNHITMCTLWFHHKTMITLTKRGKIILSQTYAEKHPGHFNDLYQALIANIGEIKMKPKVGIFLDIECDNLKIYRKLEAIKSPPYVKIILS